MTENLPWFLNLIALVGVGVIGVDIGTRISNVVSRQTAHASRLITACRLAATLLLLLGTFGALIAYSVMSQMSYAGASWLVWSLGGFVPGITIGLLLHLPGKPLRQGKQPATSTPQPQVTPRILQAPLEQLRHLEWQWLDPCATVPPPFIWQRVLDRLTFGTFSRMQLAKKDKYGLSHDSCHRFAWECAAISIRPSFAEAYVFRALDGNLIFQTMGAVDRLKGWDSLGNEPSVRY